MFSKKIMLVLSIAGVGLSTNNTFGMGAIGRTAARFIGYNIGIGLGVTATLADKPVPNHSQTPTAILHVKKKVLGYSLDSQVLFDEYKKIEPQDTIKTCAPWVLGLGIALFSRGKVTPVALGALFGAGTRIAISEEVLGRKSSKLITQKAQDALEYEIVSDELAKREHKQ